MKEPQRVAGWAEKMVASLVVSLVASLVAEMAVKLVG